MLGMAKRVSSANKHRKTRRMIERFTVSSPLEKVEEGRVGCTTSGGPEDLLIFGS
jgi:hypothetical protein